MSGPTPPCIGCRHEYESKITCGACLACEARQAYADAVAGPRLSPLEVRPLRRKPRPGVAPKTKGRAPIDGHRPTADPDEPRRQCRLCRRLVGVSRYRYSDRIGRRVVTCMDCERQYATSRPALETSA